MLSHVQLFCDPMDCSPQDIFVHGILQTRILQLVALPFSRGSSPPRTEPTSPAMQADSLWSQAPGKPLKMLIAQHTWLFAIPWIEWSSRGQRIRSWHQWYLQKWAVIVCLRRSQLRAASIFTAFLSPFLILIIHFKVWESWSQINSYEHTRA